MKLPLPTYRRFMDLYSIAEAIGMFVNQIDEAIKSLTADGVQFHSKNHLVQLIMFHSGLPMTEESFRDVENYLGEGVDELLYGVAHHE